VLNKYACMKILTKNKYEELFGLAKIPDEEIIRFLNIELGKAKAYVIELEEKIKKSKIETKKLKAEIQQLKSTRELTSAEIKVIKQDQIFNEYRSKIDQLEKIISKQRQEISFYIIKLENLQNNPRSD